MHTGEIGWDIFQSYFCKRSVIPTIFFLNKLLKMFIIAVVPSAMQDENLRAEPGLICGQSQD